MAYSSIHNMETSRLYTVKLDGETIADCVPSHHVHSLVYELESNDVNVVDEYWDEENMEVHLQSTSLLDDEDHLHDD